MKLRRLNGTVQESFDHDTATCSQEVAMLTKVPLTFLQRRRLLRVMVLPPPGLGLDDIPISNHSHRGM